MAQRPTQEDKFKNITLRLDPVALSTSHIVRNSDYRELPRPSTPVNSSSYITQDPRRLNIEIRTSHGTSSPTGLSAKSQLWQHHEQ